MQRHRDLSYAATGQGEERKIPWRGREDSPSAPSEGADILISDLLPPKM